MLNGTLSYYSRFEYEQTVVSAHLFKLKPLFLKITTTYKEMFQIDY